MGKLFLAGSFIDLASERTPMITPKYQELGYNITAIDIELSRPGHATSYLITVGTNAAFIEVGTSHANEILLQTLAAKGIARENVHYLMVTHIHLDHSGGAGNLLGYLPNARLVAHPRAIRHLLNPDKLISGATAVYGAAKLREKFGEIIAVPPTRIIAAANGFILDLHGRSLLFLDTPGHARHHYCIVDAVSDAIFSGDTFGISYRQFDNENGAFIFPSTSPVHFDPAAAHASIDRLLAYQPRYVYLTHCGRIEQPQKLGQELHHLLDEFTQAAIQANNQGESRRKTLQRKIGQILLRKLEKHGYSLEPEKMLKFLQTDIDVNVQGLEYWLDNDHNR